MENIGGHSIGIVAGFVGGVKAVDWIWALKGVTGMEKIIKFYNTNPLMPFNAP
jgi:hypothetical protein